MCIRDRPGGYLCAADLAEPAKKGGGAVSISSIVAEGAAAFGIHLGEEALLRLERYASCLLEWNKKMNLTAITRPEEVAVKHFVDSIALLSHCLLYTSRCV